MAMAEIEISFGLVSKHLKDKQKYPFAFARPTFIRDPTNPTTDLIQSKGNTLMACPAFHWPDLPLLALIYRLVNQRRGDRPFYILHLHKSKCLNMNLPSFMLLLLLLK
jgi:hypothetical protein